MEPIRRSKNQQDVGLFGWVGTVIGNALKSGTFKLSLVVVIIGGCWLFMQHRSIRRMIPRPSDLTGMGQPSI